MELGYGSSGDESKSHWLPANVIQDVGCTVGGGYGGSRVGIRQCTMTAKAVTAADCDADGDDCGQQGRSRTGPSGGGGTELGTGKA